MLLSIPKTSVSALLTHLGISSRGERWLLSTAVRATLQGKKAEASTCITLETAHCLWNVPSGNPRKNKPSAQQQFKRQLANKSQYVFSAPAYNLPRGGYLLWRNGVKLTQNIPLPTRGEGWRWRSTACSANNAARAAVLWLQIQIKYGQICACVPISVGTFERRRHHVRLTLWDQLLWSRH